jgi:hypothetical protein
MATNYELGRYIVRITGQGFSESKEKGTPCFFLKHVPLGKIDESDPEGALIQCADVPGEVVMWMTDKTIDGVISQLKELGWDGRSFNDLDPATQGFHDLTGVETTLVYKVNKGAKDDFDSWEFPRPSFGNEQKPGVSNKVDSIFAGKLNRTTQRPVPRRLSTKPQDAAIKQPHGEMPPDDEVPF